MHVLILAIIMDDMAKIILLVCCVGKCVCVCVCVCVCMNECVFVYVHIYIYAYVCTGVHHICACLLLGQVYSSKRMKTKTPDLGYQDKAWPLSCHIHWHLVKANNIWTRQTMAALCHSHHKNQLKPSSLLTENVVLVMFRARNSAVLVVGRNRF